MQSYVEIWYKTATPLDRPLIENNPQLWAIQIISNLFGVIGWVVASEGIGGKGDSRWLLSHRLHFGFTTAAFDEQQPCIKKCRSHPPALVNDQRVPCQWGTAIPGHHYLASTLGSRSYPLCPRTPSAGVHGEEAVAVSLLELEGERASF